MRVASKLPVVAERRQVVRFLEAIRASSASTAWTKYMQPT